MVDEKEEHYEEEGEYHFSDDQVNYDIEPEAATTKASSSLNRESILNKFTQNRRRILGAVSLLVLIGVVYKILVPSAPTTPATEFNPATTAMKAGAPTVTTQTKVTKVETKTAVQTTEPTVATTNPATMMPATNAPQTAAPPYTQQSQAPVVVVAAPPASGSTNLPPNSVPPSSTMPQTAGTPAMNMPPSETTPSVATTNPTMPGQPASYDSQTKDRISALEQQNTAMMNLLQTEYAQKIADSETQSTQVRGKMEELTKRVNRMESNLNQIMQMLQGMNKSQAAAMEPPSAMYNSASRGEPRMTYTVQAIIPGRAWLKSESGDTVTVAEGDYLKKYGRVTKIDPYDGIVSIDTGTKVITLAYGLDGG